MNDALKLAEKILTYEAVDEDIVTRFDTSEMLKKQAGRIAELKAQVRKECLATSDDYAPNPMPSEVANLIDRIEIALKEPSDGRPGKTL